MWRRNNGKNCTCVDLVSLKAAVPLLLEQRSDAATYQCQSLLTGRAIDFDLIACSNQLSLLPARLIANRIKQCRDYIL